MTVPKSFAQDPRPERIRPVGSLPRRDGPSPCILVRFDQKPTKSEGRGTANEPGAAIHLPLSQQVEPQRATCVAVSHGVREDIRPGYRLIVKEWMNGDRLEGTDCHWIAEDDCLAVEEP